MASEQAETRSAAAALETGRRVIRAERAGLDALADSLDTAFAEAVTLIGGATGRLIVCGVGKSGHVARKVSSTFASTGTPSFFLHAAEAGHGDLGIIGPDDVVLILSHSGQSRELLPVLQFIQRRGLQLIAVTSDAGSDLARAAGCLLPLPPVGEADPAVPAPTTSALMMLALGDALAAALWHARGFSTDDFSRLHPSGRLGVALKRVGDLLDGLPPAPQVTSQAGLREIAEAITRGGLGCALVTDTDAGNGAVIGLITDGDLRRALLHEPTREGEAAVVAQDIMTRDPLTLDAGQSAAAALALMEQRQISHLVITGRSEPESGPTILHLQRLLRAQVA